MGDMNEPLYQNSRQHLEGEAYVEFKKDEMMKGFKHAYTKEGCYGHHVRLYKALVNEYYFSGNCFYDFVFFLINWHPVLGMFLCHPAHPYSKTERLIIFAFECAATYLPSACLVAAAQAAEHHHLVTDSVGGDVQSGTILVFITLPVCIVEFALYQLAIVDIFIKDKDLLPNSKIDDYFFSGIKYFFRCCFACLSIALLGMSFFMAFLGLIVMSVSGVSLMSVLDPFLESRCQSWAIWFLTWTFLPYVGFLHGWYMEQQKYKKELEELGNPTN